jgi:hypothetical protein
MRALLERARRRRTTSLAVAVPALLLFGIVLLGAGLSFGENFGRPTPARRWVASTLVLLSAAALSAMVVRGVVLDLRARRILSRRRDESRRRMEGAVWRFAPRWKEELVCTSSSGELVLEMMIIEPHVYFPLDEAWARQAPGWAKERRGELLAALREWCAAEDIPLTVDERAWVAVR